jgi:hypothetical protein
LIKKMALWAGKWTIRIAATTAMLTGAVGATETVFSVLPLHCRYDYLIGPHGEKGLPIKAITDWWAAPLGLIVLVGSAILLARLMAWGAVAIYENFPKSRWIIRLALGDVVDDFLEV